MKLIIFVHTCKAYEESRAKLIENTWGAADNVIFITDNENSQLKSHIYVGPYTRGPTYHPETLIKMFKIFLSEDYTGYDWFMIIDDDSYLYQDRLLNFLSFFDKDDNYMIGDYLNWSATYPNPSQKTNQIKGIKSDYTAWVGGGPGIVFSKSCIKEFVELVTNNNVPPCNHDVWLHILYSLSNRKTIKRVDCPGFYQWGATLADSLLSKKDTNNVISVHLEGKMDLLNKFH